MKFILLNDMQRQRIIQKAKPREGDFFSYQNMNLLTAVCDEESGSILTRTYFLSEMIKRMGDSYDDARFVLLTENDSFSICCCEYRQGETYRRVISPCPSIVSHERLLEMLQYYDRHSSERMEMEKQAFNDSSERYGFTMRYLKNNYF